MKIQIDTKAKTLKVESDINLNELIEGVKILFPHGEWKEYKLLTDVIINNWYEPIMIQPYIQPVNPYPWMQPIIYGTTTELGIYNVECSLIN